MPTTWQKEMIDSVVLYWTLWWVWWVAMYLNQVRKWTPFKLWMFCINIFVSWLIWFWVWVSMPQYVWDIQYSIISISWFLAFPILDYIEENWLNIFIKKFLWEKK